MMVTKEEFEKMLKDYKVKIPAFLKRQMINDLENEKRSDLILWCKIYSSDSRIKEKAFY